MPTPSGSNADVGQRYPQGNIYGLNVAYATTTTATVAAGWCLNETYAKNMELAAAVTINFAVVGLNGIDTGAIGASKLYYVFLVSDSLGSNATGAMVSLSATPVMPTGADGRAYDTLRRIGWLRSGGSSTLLNFKQNGNGNIRDYIYDTMIAVLAGGTSQTLAAMDLSVAIPPIANCMWYAHAEFTPATANDSVKFTPFGSTATLIPGVVGNVAAKISSGQPKLVSALDSGVPKTLYINSAASCSASVWCYGFVDAL